MRTLADLFKDSAEKFGDKTAFRYRDHQKRICELSYSELYSSALSLAEALLHLGLKPKEHVAILSDNRVEWILADASILLSGCVDVPRGSDITDAEIVYILNHSESRIVFVENLKLLNRILRNKSLLESESIFILLQSPKDEETGAYHIYDLIEKGRLLRQNGSRKAESRISEIGSDDLFTIIYTSGTTGKPKGVQLTHSNMIHQISAVVPLLQLEKEDRAVTILPIWHIFERFLEYCCISAGASTFYSNLPELKQNLLEFKPTIFGSAPRVWEMLANGILAKINDSTRTSALTRAIFHLSCFYTRTVRKATAFLTGNELDLSGRKTVSTFFRGIGMGAVYLLLGPFYMSFLFFALGIWFGIHSYSYEFPHMFFLLGAIFSVLNSFTLDRWILSKYRMMLTGGELRVPISGGGALPNRVDVFLDSIGIRILEGYGMTETSPTISIRRFRRMVLGTVGHILPKTRLQVRSETNEVLSEIDDSGRFVQGKPGRKGIIFVQGPQVMKGYFKNEAETEAALKGGWMNTGDLGIIGFNNTLTLAGRAKETIVLRGGENVEPVPIEACLQSSEFISQCMVIGQDQKNLGAIIVPDFEILRKWAKDRNIRYSSIEDLLKNRKVIELFRTEIKSLNNSKSGFKSFEQISPFLLVEKMFEVGDELTNLQKLRRSVILEKYREKIQSLYKVEEFNRAFSGRSLE